MIRIDKPRGPLVVIAWDEGGFQAGEAIQKSLAACHDGVERVAQQLEEITEDDESAFLLLDVVQKRVQQCLAVGLAQIVFRGGVPDVQIADHEYRPGRTDRITLSLARCLSPVAVVFYGIVSVSRVNLEFDRR